MKELGEYKIPSIGLSLPLYEVDGFEDFEKVVKRQNSSEEDSPLTILVVNDPRFMQRFGFTMGRISGDPECSVYDGIFVSESGYYPQVCVTPVDYERLGFSKVKYPNRHVEIKNPVLVVDRGKKPIMVDGEISNISDIMMLGELVGLSRRRGLFQKGHYKPRKEKSYEANISL